MRHFLSRFGKALGLALVFVVLAMMLVVAIPGAGSASDLSPPQLNQLLTELVFGMPETRAADLMKYERLGTSATALLTVIYHNGSATGAHAPMPALLVDGDLYSPVPDIMRDEVTTTVLRE